MGVKPIYSQYTLNELIEAYEWINREKYPDRVEEIKKLILNYRPNWDAPSAEDEKEIDIRYRLERAGF